MSRIGFDFAFPTMGVMHNTGREFDFTTYSDGIVNFNINFDLTVPFTGDIYNGALLIGNRSPLTGDFTPDAGTPTATLVLDKPQKDSLLVIDNNIAVFDDGSFTFDN